MACSSNFDDKMEALNNYSDSMEQEELEFLIGLNEGNSKLIISLCLEKCLNLVHWQKRNCRNWMIHLVFRFEECKDD